MYNLLPPFSLRFYHPHRVLMWLLTLTPVQLQQSLMRGESCWRKGVLSS